MTLVELRSVVVRHGNRVPVLNGVDIQIARCGLTAVVGPNGSGKTTLLRVIHKLLRPCSGEVIYSNEVRPAIVFQKPVMLSMSVRANIGFPLLCSRIRRRDRERRVDELLSLAALERLADSPATKLSGGEQQRVALCRALVTRPNLLTLDEPTSNLDAISTQLVFKVLSDFKRHNAVVLVSHARDFVAGIADRIVELRNGTLHATDSEVAGPAVS